jgi:hypothetical protein
MREEEDKLLKWLGEIEAEAKAGDTIPSEAETNLIKLTAIIRKLWESNEFYANRMGSGGTARQARKEVLEMIDD